MFLSNISIKRPVMISMVMAALLLFGIISYRELPLNLMPDAKIPFLTIQTVYAGASPEQVEKQITKKIEDEISSVSRIKTISSYSLNSVSLIVLEFELDKDPDIANQELKDRIDAISQNLPGDAQMPLVSKVDMSATPVMSLVLRGNIDPTELNFIAETQVKDKLTHLKGVGSVDIIGGLDREVQVNFESSTVYENNISLTQVAGILAQANIDMPGGHFQNETEDYSVSLKGQITTIEELGSIQIPTSSGMRSLDQFASIEPVSESVRQRITYFNRLIDNAAENTVLLSVVKSPEGNPVTLASDIKKILPELQNELPEGIDLSIEKDDSLYIQDTVSDTLGNIIMGIVLTAVVLLFFLHDFRSTLIVALTMPMSIIPTFIVLKSMGITINMMSLMGLSTSVGVLVMNSVVILENIFKHKNMGHTRVKAASDGTAEVTVSVLASTMTNICVFLPIATMGGIVGIMLKDFAMTVVVATAFSLLISFTLTPMLASRLLPEHQKKKGKLSASIENFFKSLERGYTYLLEKILYSKGRSASLIGGTVLLFIFSIFLFTKVPFEFVPATDTGEIKVELELPQGTSLEETATVLEEVEGILKTFVELESMTTQQGRLSNMSEGTHLAVIDIRLIDADLRENNKIIAARMSADLASVSNTVIRAAANGGMIDGMGATVEFYLQADDMDTLKAISVDLMKDLYDIEGLVSLNSSLKAGKPEFVLIPDRRNLAEMGLSVQDLAMAMRASVEGLVLSQMKTGSREYDIRVSLNDSDMSSSEQLQNIAVPTPSGIYPLSFFAEIAINEGSDKLLRVNKKSTVEITGDTLPGVVLSDITSAIEYEMSKYSDQGVSLKWGGSADMMSDTISRMAFAFIMAIVLTYMLLAAILEKIGQPLLILSTVPMSLIGVVILFTLSGFTMNMSSMLAIVMLVGMVVNNAILILEYTNQLRSKGMTVHNALLEACPAKLQPVLMSNTATILGMLPMALGIGAAGVEMRQPMGLVSIGGLIAATFLSLFVIPALENVIESKKDRSGKNMKEIEA